MFTWKHRYLGDYIYKKKITKLSKLEYESNYNITTSQDSECEVHSCDCFNFNCKYIFDECYCLNATNALSIRADIPFTQKHWTMQSELVEEDFSVNQYDIIHYMKLKETTSLKSYVFDSENTIETPIHDPINNVTIPFNKEKNGFSVRVSTQEDLKNNENLVINYEKFVQSITEPGIIDIHLVSFEIITILLNRNKNFLIYFKHHVDFNEGGSMIPELQINPIPKDPYDFVNFKTVAAEITYHVLLFYFAYHTY